MKYYVKYGSSSDLRDSYAYARLNSDCKETYGSLSKAFFKLALSHFVKNKFNIRYKSCNFARHFHHWHCKITCRE